MSHSTRFRRSSAGYTGYGSGVGLAGLGGTGVGLSSLPPSSALAHLSASSSSQLPSTLVGSGSGGYTSTYTSAAANSYLRNYGNDLSGIGGENAGRDATAGVGRGTSYSSPARRMQHENRYDGSKIDSMLAAAGITTSSTSAVNSVTSVNAKSLSVAAPVGIRSTLRSYRRGGGGVTTGAARSHQELSSLDDRLLSGDLSSSLERRSDLQLPPAGSTASSWRVKSAGGALTSYGGDLHTDRVSRINSDVGYATGEPPAFRRRDPSLTRSEILGPSSSSLAVNTIVPSFHRDEAVSSPRHVLSAGRDRHLSSNSLMRAEELERDFEQYVVGPNNATGIREKSVLREAGIETPTRTNYSATAGGGSSRPLSRALVADGFGEDDGTDGVLEGVHRARSPMFSSSTPLRSASRTRRDLGGHGYVDRASNEGNSYRRMDPFDARGRASEPFEEIRQHTGAADRRDLFDGRNSHHHNHKEAFDGVRTPSRHGRPPDREMARSGHNDRRRGVSSCSNGRNFAGGGGIVRSNSYKDLRDFDDPHCGPRPSPTAGKSPRARHQTLAYGVSSSDLEVARGASGHGRRGSTGGLHLDAGGGCVPGSSSRDFAAEWRSSHQVPIVSNSVPGVVSFKANKELQGFASDMSVVNSSGRPHAAPLSSSINSKLPSSVTIAELEKEARAASGGAVGGAAGDLIVLKKDDLNSILTSKPTLLIGREINLADSGGRTNLATVTSDMKTVTGGIATTKDIDFRKLWEDTQRENLRLRDELGKMKDDVVVTRRKLDTAIHATSVSGLTDSELREKKVLEKKLSEMEEELKQLEHLKNDNQRLRDENGALIRVISKLSKIPGGTGVGVAGIVAPHPPLN